MSDNEIHTDEARYHIEFMLDPDLHPGMASFGSNTVGIVDNEQGGVILYCHSGSADSIMGALLWADRARPDEATGF